MSARYRELRIIIPQSLAQEIEEARQDAVGVSLGLGEAESQTWLQLLLKLGLSDAQKFTNSSRLVIPA